MAKIKLNELSQDEQISTEEMKKVFGGAGLVGAPIQPEQTAVNFDTMQAGLGGIKNPGLVSEGVCTCNDDGGNPHCAEKQRNLTDNVMNNAALNNPALNNAALNSSLGTKLR